MADQHLGVGRRARCRAGRCRRGRGGSGRRRGRCRSARRAVGERVEDVELEVRAGRGCAAAPSRGVRSRATRHQVRVEHQDRRRSCSMAITGSGSACRSRTTAASTSAISARPFTAAASGVSVAGRRHAGEQLADRGQQHARLAERGQHLADVAEEGGVRADDQHGTLGEQLPVLVEQIRGPVQRDGGLAGAGAALHDEHAAVRGADDAVLLGLDGLHDVAHPAGAGGVERGEQHRVAASGPRTRCGLVSPRSRISSCRAVTVRPSVVMCRRRRSPIGVWPVAR